jgi:protein phosphatase
MIDKRVRRVGEPVPRPKLRLAVETHIGITKRLRNPTNQDAVFGKVSDDGAFSLIVVADGVSTAEYGSGDIASAFLVAEAEKVWEELLPRYLMDDEIDAITVIGDLLAAANQNVVDYVNENFAPFSGNPHEVMGSTALISIYHEGFMTTASLGDSRIYLYNELGMEQLTVDHNLWTLSIIEGVPPDSAMGMPHGDALARCLGTFRISDGELYAIRPEPDYYRFVVLSGDTVLMTTDGLVDFAGAHKLESERNIEDVLLNEPLPDLVALEMILLANRGGGGDNIGVGVLKFGSL